MQVFDNVITLGEANEIQKAINNSGFPFYIGAGGLQFGKDYIVYDTFEIHGFDSNLTDHIVFLHSVIGWEVETNKSVDVNLLIMVLPPISSCSITTFEECSSTKNCFMALSINKF